MKFGTWDLRISPRRELRLALLAAMEACWVYAVFAFAGAWLNLLPPSAPSIFLAYWCALVLGRTLPRLQWRWGFAQLAVVASALGIAFLIAWIEIYARQALFDLAAPARFLSVLLTFADRVRAEHLIAAAVVYCFLRGLGFAQRPLTLWFIGYQFRLGIVFFFGVLILSGFLKPLDLSAWIFAYFFLALLSIALARVEEMESALTLGPRWALTFLGAVTLVIFLGLAGARVITLEVVEGSLRFLSPVWTLFAVIILMISIPFSFLADLLYNLLTPLLGSLRKMIDDFLGNFRTPTPPEQSEPLLQPNPALESLFPILKTVFVLAVLFIVGLWIAKALNRRMRRYEQENFVREQIGADEDGAQSDPHAQNARRARRRNLNAESIRRIYAALVARAGDAGIARRVAETPNEFLPRLEQSWQDRADDLGAITRAYVAAHYGEESATPEVVTHVRAAWDRVQTSIRQKRVK
ncbi:MAG: DUF4129 domain-containing protein [Chloroflexi bacterium]|nr:DUF4129 domain-containing protein [Chloroflexota bacterium]